MSLTRSNTVEELRQNPSTSIILDSLLIISSRLNFFLPIFSVISDSLSGWISSYFMALNIDATPIR